LRYPKNTSLISIGDLNIKIIAGVVSLGGATFPRSQSCVALFAVAFGYGEPAQIECLAASSVYIPSIVCGNFSNTLLMRDTLARSPCDYFSDFKKRDCETVTASSMARQTSSRPRFVTAE
jgi:hypothetical protein